MFSGLMSRWTIPCLCAYDSASAVSRAIAHEGSIAICRSRSILTRSVSPLT